MNSSLTPNTTSTVELKPSYNIPVVLVLVAIPVLLIQPWLGCILTLLGLFLMLQAVTLRFQFTATDFDLYRGEKLIRRFPYQEWQNWRIFWNQVPICSILRKLTVFTFCPFYLTPKP